MKILENLPPQSRILLYKAISHSMLPCHNGDSFKKHAIIEPLSKEVPLPRLLAFLDHPHLASISERTRLNRFRSLAGCSRKSSILDKRQRSSHSGKD